MIALRAYIDCWLSIAIMIVASALAITYAGGDLPMAVHFGIDGTPNRFMPLSQGAFLFPVILTGVTLLMIFLPQFDPRLKGVSGQMPELVSLARVLAGGLGMIHLGLLALALHFIDGLDAILHLSLGYIFIGTGNLLGKVRPNFFVGIRTPWTLSDDDVWRRTHRAGGWGMVIIGLAFLAGAFPGTPAVNPKILFAALAFYTLGIVGYSYVLWRARRTNGAPIE
jgi:uncharacterized membrane protein